ncbi:MAG: NosD domain-containing protein, partial [Candidatus Aenigmatarchaeota archaeon]
YLSSSLYNKITNNTANNNIEHGIYLADSSKNTLSNNTANSNKQLGIFLDSSSNNTLTNNTVYNNSQYGIYLYYNSNNNTLTGNTAYKNKYRGISLYSSSNNNTISNNLVDSHENHGIWIYTSKNNYITNNIVKNSLIAGIRLEHSSDNIVTNNTAQQNHYNIWTYYANNNRIFNNNFYYYVSQIYSDFSSNFFNVTYPVGGNYFSNYDTPAEGCNDVKSGPNQDQPGGDCICDTPYSFTGGKDWLPWAFPNGWISGGAPPVSNITLVGEEGENGWYLSNVSVTLTASGGCQPPVLHWKIDDGEEQTGSSPQAFNVTGEGVHTLEYWAVSGSAVEEHHFQIIKIEYYVSTVAPQSEPFPGEPPLSIWTGAVAINDPGMWDNDGSVTLTWEPLSTPSGVAAYYVTRCQTTDPEGDCLIGQQPQVITEEGLPSTQLEYTDTGLADNTKYMWTVIALSNAGNWYLFGPHYADVIVDKTPPYPPVVDSLPTYINTAEVTVSWSESTDPGVLASGVKLYNLFNSVNSGAFYLLTQTTPAVREYLHSGLSHGSSYAYKVNAEDNADNVGNESNTVSTTVDMVAPTTTVELFGNINNGWYTTPVSVILECTDDISGCAQTFYTADGIQQSGASPIVLKVTGDGSHSVTFYSADYAGNTESQKSVSFSIDTTPPTTTATVTGTAITELPGWYRDSASVTLTATDAHSGVAQTFYCIDTSNVCTPNTAYTGSITLTTLGLNYVRFASIDVAGNLETPKSQFVGIDTDADNDGYWDYNVDICDGVAGPFTGCPVADKTSVELHIIDQAKSGACEGGAGSCKLPLEFVEIRVYDRNNPTFQAAYGKNPSGTLYAAIFDDLNLGSAIIGSCLTDSTGSCLAPEPNTGDFLVLARYIDFSTGKNITIGRPKSASDFVATTVNGMPAKLATKDMQVIKTIQKDGTVSYKGGSKTVVTGSELTVIYPDNVVWEDNNELYPFIFTSDVDWDVNLCLNVPSGYKIAGFYDDAGNLVSASCMQTFLSGETKTALFVLSKTGSPEPEFDANLKVKRAGLAKQVKLKLRGAKATTVAAAVKKAQLVHEKGVPFNPLAAIVGAISGDGFALFVALMVATAVAIAATLKKPSTTKHARKGRR